MESQIIVRIGSKLNIIGLLFVIVSYIVMFLVVH